MTAQEQVPPVGHDTVMWEARAAPGRQAELLAWVRGQAIPAVLRAGCLRAEVFGSADARLVVIARFAAGTARFPEPPRELVGREPHAWPFRHLSSHGPAGDGT